MDGVLARWNALAPGQAPAALGERLEELFLEASMLEAVRTRCFTLPANTFLHCNSCFGLALCVTHHFPSKQCSGAVYFTTTLSTSSFSIPGL